MELLSDTQKAQDQAQAAIVQAEHDIELSEKDLKDIVSVTTEAQKKASNTTASVDSLDARLKELQRKSVRNNFVLDQEIRGGLSKVAEDARLVKEKSARLGVEYKKADDSLNYRVSKSKGDIQRAKKLLQRASELTADTSTKFKDLDGMDSVYRDNDKLLGNLMKDVDYLTAEMERQLSEIETKSQRYRQCQT